MSFLYTKILVCLSKKYSEKGGTHLDTSDDTLIATMLAAQCTDAAVLKAMPGLRRKFPDWKSLAVARIEDIAKTIRTLNLYKTKARAVKETAIRIQDVYAGCVPRTMEDLITLRGVGRKTASVVLSACFHIPAIAIDTHVQRIVCRLGWTKKKKPIDIEKDLMKFIPKKYWSTINSALVPFGRDICKARKPECYRCPIAAQCPYSPKTVLS